MQSWCDAEGRWGYPLLVAEILTVVLYEVETYVLIRQNAITQYIATHPILYLCLEAELWTGVQVA